MNATEQKAREMRVDSHQRLVMLFEQAKIEATRIKVLDEVLGENSLEEQFARPFLIASERGGSPVLPLPSKVTPSSSTSSSKRTTRRKKQSQTSSSNGSGSGAGEKPKKRRKTSGSKQKKKLAAVIQDVLSSHPGAWLTARDILDLAAQEKKLRLNYDGLKTTIRKLRLDEADWLRAHIHGRRGWYSLSPSAGGTAPDEPPQANE
jgi:hypothetical protein